MNDVTLRSASLHFVRVTHKTCWTFLRLHSEDGRTGEGEATLIGQEDSLVLQANRLVPVALSEASTQDPGAFARRHASDNIRQASIISAIDQALWSLHAQMNGQSLAQTLGVERDRIPVYANINRRTESRTPAGFAASAQKAIAAGHVAFKIAPFDEVSPKACAQGDGARAMQVGLSRVAAVRKVVGPRARLMIDCHWRFDEPTARALNEAAAKLGVYWIETPMVEVEDNIAALARLRRQCNSLGMRQAGLETSVGWNTIRPYCEADAYDVVMPDMKYIGGLHEMQRTVEACASLGVLVSPHNPSGPICHAASLQVSTVLTAFDMLELQFDESPLFDQLVSSPFAPIIDGYTKLPAGQGIGAVLSEAVIANHADQPVREWRG